MSGGHFDYNQDKIKFIYEDIECMINSEEFKGFYETEVEQEIIKGLEVLKKAFVYAQRIDWLISGDDGEDSFLIRLEEDLNKLK